MPEEARLPDNRPVFEITRPRTRQSVLFRMVVGQGLTGLFLFFAIAISVWQLNLYNDARRDWEATLERLSLITNVRQDSTVLVLVTHRVAFTQAPFRYLSPERIRFPTDSIAVSAAALRVSGNNLEEEAAALPENDPIGKRLRATVDHLDELLVIADTIVDLGMAGDWQAAQSIASSRADASTLPQFEKIHVDLVGELRKAQILIQQQHVAAEEQMIQSSRTAIAVTVVAVGTVVLLGVLLGISTIRSISKPVGHLSVAAARLAEGEFDTRVPVARQDELGRLAMVFNYMAGELHDIYSGLEARAGTAEARLIQAIESIPDGFVLYDADDRLVLCNEKYREKPAGIAGSIVPGARFEDLIRQAATFGYYAVAPLSVNDWVERRLERHRNPQGSFELQLTSGRWLRISEYRTQEGGIFGIRADITEQKRAERELREAKDAAEARAEQLATLNRITQTVAAVYDLQPTLEVVAREMVELFDARDCGVALLNEERTVLTVVADHSREASDAGSVGNLITLASNPLSAQVVNSGRSRIVSRSQYSPWTDATNERVDTSPTKRLMIVPLRTHGDVIGTIGVATDQADREFTSAEVELAETVAGQLAGTIENARLFDARNEFLASVSHELRVPLTAVYGLTAMTRKRLETRILPNVRADDFKTKRAMKQVVSNFKIILGEGQRLTNFINNVLDSASGQLDLHREPLTIREVIERALAGTSYLAGQKNLELIKDIPDELPEILGDRDRLIQVVINLISNAVKFTAEGSVTCRVRQDDGELIVSIIDTGVGIAVKDRPKLFKKFSQVGERHRGTGLGLSISKIIVELHGGRIWLQESRQGHGSIFAFTLPVASSTAEEASSAEFELKTA
jgi:signal transduction histidine kinase